MLSAAQDESVMMFSTLTGNIIKNSELGPDYWLSNLLNPVRFDVAIEQLLTFTPKSQRQDRSAMFIDTMIEIGPHGALQVAKADYHSSCR